MARKLRRCEHVYDCLFVSLSYEEKFFVVVSSRNEHAILYVSALDERDERKRRVVADLEHDLELVAVTGVEDKLQVSELFFVNVKRK